jgi:ATP-dependent helicase/nuclease subunit B
VIAGLQADRVGVQLLQLLARLKAELQAERTQLTFVEWRAWLSRQLENETFRDSGIASPIVFTHLALTRMRSFDGVVMLGCDEAHLPGIGAETRFFNQGVRAQLGLPTLADDLDRQRADLAGLIANAQSVYVTWQSWRAREPNLLSPVFERLRVFHQIAFQDDLVDAAMAAVLPRVPVGQQRSAPLARSAPAPRAHPDLVPARISASGYNSLMACPYQFYARHMLGLNELDEVQEALEKKDYGEFVHAILRRFHERHPLLGALERGQLEAELGAISEQAFAEALRTNFLSHAWLARWQALIPGYIDWQLERERSGWRFHAGEALREIRLVLAGGKQALLRGRLDRIDVRDDGCGPQYAVIDYKTQATDILRNKLESAGEDVQLGVYLLLQTPSAAAAFLSLDKGRPVEVSIDGDVAQLAGAVRARLVAMLDALHGGAALGAQGMEGVCRYCDVRGLCRKDHWND